LRKVEINTFFLPALGSRLGDGPFNGMQGIRGVYWSSTQLNFDGGYVLFSDSNGSNPARTDAPKTYSYNIRCVRKSKEKWKIKRRLFLASCWLATLARWRCAWSKY